ncbi:hypothetical protein HDU76_004514 [Blyttiomyces sp. JEL0837]|nr:hypothetical protein HDU76_004514 [Blyttiomyces sp. JEL0837]
MAGVVTCSPQPDRGWVGPNTEAIKIYHEYSGESSCRLNIIGSLLPDAASDGNLDLVIYLNRECNLVEENERLYGAIDSAVMYNHLHINDRLECLKVLLDTRYIGKCRLVGSRIERLVGDGKSVFQAGCQIAFDAAVMAGSLRIVRYLIENGFVEACETKVLKEAVQRGFIHTISYVYERLPLCRGNFVADLVDEAAYRGNILMMGYLADTCGLTCSQDLLDGVLNRWIPFNKVKVVAFIMRRWGGSFGAFQDTLRRIYASNVDVKDEKLKGFFKANERVFKKMIGWEE